MQDSKLYLWESMVLGMHDALVSTLGLITGLVFAAAEHDIVVLTGIIASVAAGLSMTASEYLANRVIGDSRAAILRGIATGITYVFTAGFLLVPFVFISNPFVALLMAYTVAISVIFFFNYVKSKLCHDKFWPRFFEMLTICLVVTVTAFLIGEAAKIFFGVEI